MLKAGDIVKRLDGKRYIVIPNFLGGADAAGGKDHHPDAAGYMKLDDAQIENLEKVGDAT